MIFEIMSSNKVFPLYFRAVTRVCHLACFWNGYCHAMKQNENVYFCNLDPS